MVVSQAPSPTAVTCGAYHNSLYTYYNSYIFDLSQIFLRFSFIFLISQYGMSEPTGGVGGSGGVGGVGGTPPKI